MPFIKTMNFYDISFLRKNKWHGYYKFLIVYILYTMCFFFNSACVRANLLKNGNIFLIQVKVSIL